MSSVPLLKPITGPGWYPYWSYIGRKGQRRYAHTRRCMPWDRGEHWPFKRSSTPSCLASNLSSQLQRWLQPNPAVTTGGGKPAAQRCAEQLVLTTRRLRYPPSHHDIRSIPQGQFSPPYVHAILYAAVTAASMHGNHYGKAGLGLWTVATSA